MAVKYLYKCNPLVAEAAGVTEFSRYRWPDGCFLLWENDLIAIDRERFFLDNENLLADLGVVKLTDPQCAEEQRDPRIRLPEARLAIYRWIQPHPESDTDSASDGEGEPAPAGEDTSSPAGEDSPAPAEGEQGDSGHEEGGGQ